MSSQVPLYSLDTPSQYPVIALVGGSGDVADLSEYIPDNTLASFSRHLMPAGAKAESISRSSFLGNASVLASGRLHLIAIALPAEIPVTNISFMAGSTGLSAGTNQWFGLFDSSRVKLGVTSDDTNTAWAASTLKTLALTTPFVTTYTGLYYLGIVVVATTVPVLVGSGSTPATSSLPPILSGNSNTGLTNPASCPATAAALTGTTTIYAFVS